MSGSAICVSNATTPSSPWCTSVMRGILHRRSGIGIHRVRVARRLGRMGLRTPDPDRARGPATRVRRRRSRRPGPRRPTRSRCSAAGCTTRSSPGCTSPTRWWSPRVSAEGRPSSRMVLLKGVDERGFVFYTNYDSRKGRELDGPPAGRRCSSRGTTCSARSASRGRPTRVSARGEPRPTSPPGRAAPSSAPGPRRSRGRWPRRAELEASYAEVRGALRRPATCPCPPYWGGYRVAPRRRRVLAGPQGPDARPAGLPARGGGWTTVRLAP